MNFRLDYTIRDNGLERDCCRYCPDLLTLNEALAEAEKVQAWNFSVHEATAEAMEAHWEWLAAGMGA